MFNYAHFSYDICGLIREKDIQRIASFCYLRTEQNDADEQKRTYCESVNT